MLKTKTISILTFFTFLLSALLFIPSADARGRGRGMGPDDAGPGPRMLDLLDLSSEQKDQLKAIRRANRDNRNQIQDRIEDARDHLQNLMQSDASEDELRAAHKKVQEAMQAAGNDRFEQMLKIRAILTPEQRKELGTYRDGRKGRRGRSGPRGF